jgi:hypothetical protein
MPITNPHDPASTLTKREQFASEAMATLLCNAAYPDAPSAAAGAVVAADALIAQLNATASAATPAAA